MYLILTSFNVRMISLRMRKAFEFSSSSKLICRIHIKKRPLSVNGMYPLRPSFKYQKIERAWKWLGYEPPPKQNSARNFFNMKLNDKNGVMCTKIYRNGVKWKLIMNWGKSQLPLATSLYLNFFKNCFRSHQLYLRLPIFHCKYMKSPNQVATSIYFYL